MNAQREIITSRQNPRVRQAASLKEKSARDLEDRFLVEGLRELSRALDADRFPETVFFCPGLFKRADESRALLGRASAARVEMVELGEEAFGKVGYREGSDGLIGVCRRWPTGLSQLAAPPGPPLYLVVEAVEKPGNLGALLRTADASGCDAVLVCDQVVDLFNPNAVRSSQGALFSMPVAVGSSREVEGWLRERGVRLFAATPSAKDLYWDSNYKDPAALVFGGEKDGLSDFWLSKADFTVAIPQLGGADSLNVGMAAAICLFEAVRQRARRP